MYLEHVTQIQSFSRGLLQLRVSVGNDDDNKKGSHTSLDITVHPSKDFKMNVSRFFQRH